MHLNLVIGNLVVVTVSAVFVKSFNRVCSFFLFQELGFLGKVNNKEPCHDSRHDCHKTFDNEDPSPAFNTFSVDLREAVCEDRLLLEWL